MPPVPPAIEPFLASLNENTWDGAAWQAIFDHVGRLPVDVAREYYELFFKCFPHAGVYWCRYIDHERKVRPL